MAKTIVVFTATGDQGKSVTTSMLEAGWNVIGLTRNPDSESSKALAKKGVTMHKGDLDDPDSYKDALKGADAAFINTDFWTIYGHNGQDGPAAKKGETTQAINAFKACAEAGVKHVVQSTLDGTMDVVHWDSKYEATQWAKENNIPGTYIFLSYYISGMVRYGLLKPSDKEGEFTLQMPIPDDIAFPGTIIEQLGLWVRLAVEDPDKWIGKDMICMSDDKSVGEMAKILSELSGKKVETGHMTKEIFFSDGMRKNMGEEQWSNWRAFNNQEVKGDVKESRALVKGAWDFKDWAKQNPELKKMLGY